MRISDWSSDVCSSDLLADAENMHGRLAGPRTESLRSPVRDGFETDPVLSAGDPQPEPGPVIEVERFGNVLRIDALDIITIQPDFLDRRDLARQAAQAPDPVPLGAGAERRKAAGLWPSIDREDLGRRQAAAVPQFQANQRIDALRIADGTDIIAGALHPFEHAAGLQFRKRLAQGPDGDPQFLGHLPFRLQLLTIDQAPSRNVADQEFRDLEIDGQAAGRLVHGMGT